MIATEKERAKDMSTRNVIVLGSINVDYVAPVERLPGPGETIKTDRYDALPGGKGANQALAAARNGAATAMVGAVGSDGLNAVALSELQRAGTNLDGVKVHHGASGLAMIAVDAAGENQIIVVSGANAAVQATDLPDLNGHTILVTQNEITWTETAQAHARARGQGAMVIHNAAPAHRLSASELGNIDVLVVNEHELALAAANDSLSEGGKAEHLLAQGVGAVILTLGAKGARLFQALTPTVQVDAVQTKVVDTTGAGDAFVGACVAALAAGLALPGAVAQANAYAARVCGVLGAQTPPAEP